MRLEKEYQGKRRETNPKQYHTLAVIHNHEWNMINPAQRTLQKKQRNGGSDSGVSKDVARCQQDVVHGRSDRRDGQTSNGVLQRGPPESRLLDLWVRSSEVASSTLAARSIRVPEGSPARLALLLQCSEPASISSVRSYGLPICVPQALILVLGIPHRQSQSPCKADTSRCRPLCNLEGGWTADVLYIRLCSSMLKSVLLYICLYHLGSPSSERVAASSGRWA
jgi:hypothetical protein